MSTTHAPDTASHAKKKAKKPAKGGTTVFGIQIGKKQAAADGPVDRPPFTATLPIVSLLSPKIEAQAQIRRMRRNLALTAVGVVGAIAALWVGQAAQIAAAENRLADVTEQGQQIQARVNALQPIKAFYTAVQQQANTVSTLLSAEVLTSQVMTAVDKTRANVAINSESISYTAPYNEDGTTGGGCPNADPFNPTVNVGCVTFQGAARSRADISLMLQALAKDPVFVSPYVSSTAVEATGENGANLPVTFQATVGLTAEALSGRYGLPAPPEPDPATAQTTPGADPAADPAGDPAAADPGTDPALAE